MKTKTLVPVVVIILALLGIVYLLASPPRAVKPSEGPSEGQEQPAIDESDYLDDVVSDLEDLEETETLEEPTEQPVELDESDYLDDVLSDLDDLAEE
jgi:hypothetical protein